MTSESPNERNPVEAALAAATQADDQEGTLRVLANADVVVPQPEGGSGDDQGGTVSLLVLEQGGQRYIPVFTSTERMEAAAPGIQDSVTMPMPHLAAQWPSDELWLALNPGTEEGIAVPPEVVRSLPLYAEST